MTGREEARDREMADQVLDRICSDNEMGDPYDVDYDGGAHRIAQALAAARREGREKGIEAAIDHLLRESQNRYPPGSKIGREEIIAWLGSRLVHWHRALLPPTDAAGEGGEG